MGINFADHHRRDGGADCLPARAGMGVPGIGGLALAALLTVPLGGVFGFLIGKLLNRMKGAGK